MIGTCRYCGNEDEDLRPYGKNGVYICFTCGMKPENIKETEKQFHDLIKDVDMVVIVSGLE